MAVSIGINIKQNSQSIANNTSNVTVSVIASWTYGSYNQLQKPGSLTIDGVKYDFTSSFNYNATQSGSETIFTKTVNVAHGSNGKKTLACSASYTSGVSSGTVSATGSKVLTTILRASYFGTVTGSTIGYSMTVNVSRYNSAYTHQIWYKLGNSPWYDLGIGIGTSITFTVDTNLCSQLPNSTSGTLELCLRTYNGSTQIGNDAYKNVTVNVPVDVKPSVSIAASDPTGLFGKYGKYVKGKSKLKIDVTGTGLYGSSIKSYNVTADGKTYTSASITTDVILSSGLLAITATVTDSRGRTATASITPSVLDYSIPKISGVKANRSDAQGNSNSSGAYLSVSFSAEITSLENKNAATYIVQYKKSNDATYTTATLTEYSGQYSVKGGTFVFPAEKSSSYDIVFTASDDFTTTTIITTGASIKKLFSLFTKGLGIAFGKVAEKEGMEIAFDVHLTGKMVQEDMTTALLQSGWTNYSGYEVSFILEGQVQRGSFGWSYQGRNNNRRNRHFHTTRWIQTTFKRKILRRFNECNLRY